MHEWILDSDASFCATSNKLWFDHLHESDGGNVVWGRVAFKINSKGSVTGRFDSDLVHTLKEVRYIPLMDRNLILVKGLERTSFIGTIDDGVLKIFKGALRPLRLLGTMAVTSCVLK